ncbi:heterotrimeric G protein alpha subunit [Boletus edulis BED1]|uniref:Guanine nucleotide-binding protein subunit alpha n=1 Tax=Boletus edulis BED1 TaxID=1328754 RepID=A0AAD4BEK3_BOLED|nr:heterotrimeric G protein alpha subunit [Boletus edulis BED1]
MGNCFSVHDPARAKSQAIDQFLLEDSKRFKRECKVLLLGSGESGKSTVVKQMKVIHQNGFTDEELMTYRSTIYQNTLDSAQAIVLAMSKIDLECVDPNNRVNAKLIFDYRIDPSLSFELSPEIAEAIHQLWQDPIIPKLMDHTSEFYLMDSAVYFFTDVVRIGTPNYLPTENDVLRARLKTTGITETRFTMGQLQIHMFDVGGQRSERKKWIHCFESVTSIIFCTALSEYDQVLLEEKNQVSPTSIILFLNKIDVFKTKLPKVRLFSDEFSLVFLTRCQVPLERYFPEYSGGADINKAAKYILWRFMQTNRARLSVYPHLTQATDTTNIRLVFAGVKETILQNALKDSGIL